MAKTLCDVLWVEMEWELGKALSKNKRRKKRESGGEKETKSCGMMRATRNLKNGSFQIF